MIETVTRGRRALLLRAAAVCCCFVAAPALADAPRPYGFRYAVHDRRTGDAKSQNEEGDGLGGVRGSYSLVEPDGSTRVVEYTADDERGFVARVRWTAPVHEASPSDEPGAMKRRPLDEQHRPLDEQHRPLDEQHRPLDEQHRPLDEQHRPLDEQHRPLDEQHRPLDEQHRRDVGTPRPGAPPSAYEFNVIAASDAQQPSVSPLSVHSYDV